MKTSKVLSFQKKFQDDSVDKLDQSDNKLVIDNKKCQDVVEKASIEADNFASSYLFKIFMPLILVFIFWSLVYEKHLTWYSWVITSLTGSIYTFGFIFMCPQLYINFKLKSVSHLPWNVRSSSHFSFYLIFSSNVAIS